MTRFAILLPLTGIRKTFTYSIPSYFSSKEYIGHRAIVPFRHTLQAGIITNITTKAPDYKVLPLLSMPDATPLLNESQFSFLQWLSTYYLSSIEEAIPIALGSIYPFIAPFPRLLPSAYTAIKDQHLVDLLHHLSSLQPFNTQKIIEVLGSQGEWVQLLERLVRANAITLANPLIDTLPKQKQVSLATFYTGDDGRVEIKGLIGKKAKQQQVLEAYLRLTGASYNKMPVWIEKKRLLAEDISSYSLRTLLKKNIFIEQKKTATWPPLPTPNSYAYQEYLTYIKAIEHGWKSQGVVLLQGGSSTALTKISLQIALQNAQDGTVLYLLPTIKQITVHLPKIKKFFGEHYGIYHAETKASEKLRIRHALQKGKLKLVVGTRSALFLPFAKLATIIVTEEENQAYKQTIQSMRYHVIDAARIRAKQERARVLLTTTTPSITSYYHASNHRYGYVKIPYQASVPIRLVHVKRKKKLSRTPYQLAPAIISFLRNRYSKNQQSIVLHNRRGYAAYIRCSACYWFPSCVKCDRSLSYHQTKNQLICHYCKVVASVPSSCIKCSSQRLQYQKMGTQQVEELVQLYMPEARVQRIDGDVVKGTKKYLEALHLFRDKKIDILVATPSIINLMPIGDPCMIVVLSIEDWFYPSFTTYEKNYQLLARLSQKTIATSLVIQLRWYRNPELTQLVQNLIQQNYTAIYNHMLAERKDYNYPPYAGLIKVSWLHIAKNKVIDLSEKCTELYTKQLGLEVLGPTPARKSNCKYKVVLWCKLPHTVDAKRLKKEVYRIAYEQLDPSIRPKAQLIFDVDPI